MVWSVEPAVVRDAANVCLGLARASAPELVEHVGERPPPPADEQLRLAAAITARTLGQVT